MKVVFTEDALHDLDDIVTWLALHYPQVVAEFTPGRRFAPIRAGSFQ